MRKLAESPFLVLAYNLISHTFSVDGEHLQRTVLLWYYMELFEVKDIWSMVIWYTEKPKQHCSPVVVTWRQVPNQRPRERETTYNLPLHLTFAFNTTPKVEKIHKSLMKTIHRAAAVKWCLFEQQYFVGRNGQRHFWWPRGSSSCLKSAKSACGKYLLIT